ncbi:MAG: YihY/virulence factor BrkB family protein [Armatimonadetes bacterium]|nr:YihY/virulence factor BrkB family protein [Armatimonadota bacterium]
MRLPGRVGRAFEFLKTVFSEYSKDNGSLVAAAVSFYAFLSLIPLILLAIAIGSYFLGSPRHAEDLILSLVRKNAPALTVQGGFDIRKVVEQVIRGRGAATGFGLITLLWTGTSVISNFENAINLAWNVEQKRGFVRQRLLAVGLLLMMGMLLGVSVGITATINAVRKLQLPIVDLAPGWAWALVGYAVPILITIATFTLFYKIIPYTRVRWAEALIGGVFAGVLWEIAKFGFSYYVTNFANYSAVYGSLAGVILLLVWIYYSAIVTILGAEVASVWAGRRL